MSNKPDIADEPDAGLSFKEKSLWVTVVSTVVIYAYYFWRVIEIGDGDPGAVAGLFVGIVIAMTVLHVVTHAAMAIYRRPEHTDERDRRIAVIGARNAYYVLMTGVWGALGVTVLQLGAFWFAHAGLLAVVLAELTRCGSQLIHYRRGT
jgi:hypothetical protein